MPGMKATMKEYKAGKLHSGKKGPGKGPVVKSREQAIAIGLSQAREASPSFARKYPERQSKEKKLERKLKGKKF